MKGVGRFALSGQLALGQCRVAEDSLSHQQSPFPRKQEDQEDVGVSGTVGAHKSRTHGTLLKIYPFQIYLKGYLRQLLVASQDGCGVLSKKPTALRGLICHTEVRDKHMGMFLI